MIGLYIGWMKFVAVWIVVAGLAKTAELILAVATMLL